MIIQKPSKSITETFVESTYSRETGRIASILARDFNKVDDPSLFGGKMGMLLFHAYYAKQYPTKFAMNLVSEFTENIFADLESKPLRFSLVNGISGIYWGLHHINNLYDGELFDKEMLEDLSPLIEEFIFTKLAENNYDLFYGAMGGYLAMLESGTADKNIHDRIYQCLMDSSTYGSNSKYWWTDTLNFREGKVLNLGLAHGLPSVWRFLELLYDHTHNERIKSVLYSSVLTIDDLLLEKSNSIVPIEIFLNENYVERDSNNRRSSKLSWCYGDLCMAYGMLRAGKFLNNQQIFEKGVWIAKETLKRDTLESAGVFDACICHGTTSCIHFYRRFYQMTGLQEFMSASDYWFRQGLQFATDDGYKLLEPEEDDMELSPYSLLDGITGIGLAYLSATSQSPLKWDSVLLLS